MLALYAAVLIVALFLIPGILFRGIFSLFLHMREFRRTRAEEIAFAAKVALVPLILAIWLAGALHVTSYGRQDPSKTGAALSADLWSLYRGAVDDSAIKDRGWPEYQGAGGRVLAAGEKMLLLYYLLLVVEAILLGWLCSQYGALRKRRVVGRILEKLLVPSISEWYMILTTFAQPERDAVTTVADVLTTDDHLYHGSVENYHLESDGKLRGLLLGGVYRFDRVEYVKAKQHQASPSKAEFWREIPGQNLYVLGARIANMNISYESPVAIEVKKKLGLDPTLKLDITSLR